MSKPGLKTEGMNYAPNGIACDCEYSACSHVPSQCGNVATSHLVAFGFSTYRCEECAEGLRLSGEVTVDEPFRKTEGFLSTVRDFLDPPFPAPSSSPSSSSSPEHTKQGQYMCTYCMGSGCFKCNYNGWTEAVEKIVGKLLEDAAMDRCVCGHFQYEHHSRTGKCLYANDPDGCKRFQRDPMDKKKVDDIYAKGEKELK